MCYMLSDVISVQVHVMLEIYCKHFRATWVHFDVILGNVGAILEPLWEALEDTWVHPGA